MRAITTCRLQLLIIVSWIGVVADVAEGREWSLADGTPLGDATIAKVLGSKGVMLEFPDGSRESFRLKELSVADQFFLKNRDKSPPPRQKVLTREDRPGSEAPNPTPQTHAAVADTSSESSLVARGGAQARTWSDATGQFSVEATLIGVENNAVQLKKGDGTVITVPLDRLSAADQAYVLQAAPEESAEPAPQSQCLPVGRRRGLESHAP